MPLNHKVRSIRGLTQKDREFEKLLSRAASRLRRDNRSRAQEIQKQPALDTAAEPPEENGFNSKAMIPFGLTTEHIYRSLTDFTDFMRFIDIDLASQRIARFEDLLTTSNFSSMVSEFMSVTIPNVLQNRCKE